MTTPIQAERNSDEGAYEDEDNGVLGAEAEEAKAEAQEWMDRV